MGSGHQLPSLGLLGQGWDGMTGDVMEGWADPRAHPGADPSMSHGGRMLMLLPWLALTWNVA